MNDTELDRLLDAWQPPAPSPSLRLAVQRGARTLEDTGPLPNGRGSDQSRDRKGAVLPERRRFVRPLRWVLVALAVASAALAVAMEQSSEPVSDYPIVRLLGRIYEHIADALEAHRAIALVWQIRLSDPKVYVDGQPAAPLQSRHANVLRVQVPGDGPYLVTFWSRGLQGWTEAGRVHGSAIEFQAGAHHVVIQCSRPLGSSDTPVFVRGRQ
jgi:hypothetical protein